MLVLLRRVGETIHIGDDVTVTVLEVIRGRVRIGINAPKDLPIYRAELYEKIVAALGGEADTSE